jgi:hypothetical protein
LENLDLRGCRLLQTYPSSNEQLFVQVDGDNNDDMPTYGYGDDSYNDGTDKGTVITRKKKKAKLIT